MQFAEIALVLVVGETRIERHANRIGCNSDHCYRGLWSVRQHYRDPVSSADTDAPELANYIVRLCPQRAIGHRGEPGGQNGVAVGRVSPIVGEKVTEA